MKKNYKKEEFTSNIMRQMKIGETITVAHQNFKSMDSTLSQIRLYKKRNEVPNLKAEADSKTYKVRVTLIPA